MDGSTSTFAGRLHKRRPRVQLMYEYQGRSSAGWTRGRHNCRVNRATRVQPSTLRSCSAKLVNFCSPEHLARLFQPTHQQRVRFRCRQRVRDRDFLPNRFSARRWIAPASARICERACTPGAALIFLINRDRYKAGSSSKRHPELWIKVFFSTASTVYAFPEVLNKPCIWLARNLYKFLGDQKVSRSAHSFLWICMGLSTVAWP